MPTSERTTPKPSNLYSDILLLYSKTVNSLTVIVTIDSFKIRVQNSLKNNFNQRKIRRHLIYIDNKIEEYEKVLDLEDNVDIKKKIVHNQDKKINYERIAEQLKNSGDGQLTTTDAEAKAVVFQCNSEKVGYNIPPESECKHKLLIAADAGDINDT